MAKRRKPRKSSKCPEPFNTLLDIAGGIAMNAIANKAEKKYNYSKKGKINPYKVSAFKIGTGGFKSSGDILRTGAFLGAMGSFDVETNTPSRSSNSKHNMKNSVPDDSIFNQIKYTPTKNNKYAWRLNCEDGSEYGVDPCNYETRDEYNAALEKAKGLSEKYNHVPFYNCEEETIFNENVQSFNGGRNFMYKVSLLSNGENIYCFPSKEKFGVGERVVISMDDACEAEAIVISVHENKKEAVHADCGEAKIIRRV